MKTRLLMALMLVAMVAAFTPTARACEPLVKALISPALKDGELAFVQDGNDLVASMALTINGSAHVAITDSHVDAKTGDVTLIYTIVQNSDRLVRSQKRVELTWRLADRVKGNATYRAAGSVKLMKSNQIKALSAELLGMTGEIGLELAK